jgi:hypothetical protein
MHSLYQIFSNRFLQFSTIKQQHTYINDNLFLTNDPLNAKFFLIPYDILADIPHGGDKTRALPGCRNAKKVMKLLNESIPWQESKGKNHILIIPTLITNVLTHRHCGEFVLSFCRNCLKLTIEDYFHSPYFTTHYSINKSIRQLTFHPPSKDLSILLDDSSRFIVIPYPSCFHFPNDWQQKEFLNYFESSSPRPLLSIFIGTNLQMNPLDKEDQKEEESHSVHIQSYQNRIIFQSACESVGSPVCQWISMNNRSQEIATSFIELYRQSNFCLMPKGDTFSRKALIDALLAGCIPVVFHLESCHLLMPWYLPIETAQTICEYYPEKQFLENPMQFFIWLETFRSSPELLVMRRHTICQIAKRLQYHDLLPDTNQNSHDNKSNLDRKEGNQFGNQIRPDPPENLDAFQYLFWKLQQLPNELT